MKYWLAIIFLVPSVYALDLGKKISSCGEYSLTGLLSCKEDSYSLVLFPDSLSKIKVNLKKGKDISLNYFCNSYIESTVKVYSKRHGIDSVVKPVDKLSFRNLSSVKLVKGTSCLK